MSLRRRLDRLEARDGGASTEAELRATVDALARAHDLPLDELLDETRRVLAMTPAAREAHARALGIDRTNLAQPGADPPLRHLRRPRHLAAGAVRRLGRPRVRAPAQDRR